MTPPIFMTPIDATRPHLHAAYAPDPHLIPGRFCPTCPAQRNSAALSSWRAAIPHLQYEFKKRTCCEKAKLQ